MKKTQHKCTRCLGEPRQHNIRDAQIVIRDGNGGMIVYPQHGFALGGN